MLNSFLKSVEPLPEVNMVQRNLGEAAMIGDAGEAMVANMLNSVARNSLGGSDPRLINWKIINRGKQTILVL